MVLVDSGYSWSIPSQSIYQLWRRDMDVLTVNGKKCAVELEVLMFGTMCLHLKLMASVNIPCD